MKKININSKADFIRILRKGYSLTPFETRKEAQKHDRDTIYHNFINHYGFPSTFHIYSKPKKEKKEMPKNIGTFTARLKIKISMWTIIKLWILGHVKKSKVKLDDYAAFEFEREEK
jgi:hypothetical protein